MASVKLLARSGLLASISIVPVIQSTPDYSTGDLIGGKLELEDAVKFGGGGGLIQSVMLTNKADAVGVNKDVIFFSSDPAGTTFTENAALNLIEADVVKIVGVAQINTWVDMTDTSIGFALDLAMPFVLASGVTSLFCAMIERGTMNYDGVGDLTLKVNIMAA